MLQKGSHLPPAPVIREALLRFNEEISPLEELIATGEAVFSIINLSDMDLPVKDAIFQLEKQFKFFAALAEEEVKIKK